MIRETTLKYIRQLKYLYLRFIRLKGEPRELALGTAIGIFSGMMPILPFQTALAVTLAIFLRGSKIAAAIGTWVSNPLNWFFLYHFSYKTGAWILGLSGKSKIFTSLMISMRQEEGAIVILGKILGAGSTIMAAFLIGGFVMGIITGVPSYFIFLRFFTLVKAWREQRRNRKYWQNLNP
ncbi:MAG: DUF2062 domain-containing protein [Desulfobacteraceae bacterium]|jgi:uncharacterized protein (DUF2062 family)